mmetsp:Transcript_3680/g.12242  ORF Transcript_3680/g.12242 Transcript_3680/m.12242 type:complete len:522 (+) Transcript_3680:1360-2925(+)
MGHDPRGSGGGVARGRWEQNRPARPPSFDLVLPARAQSLVVERRQGEEVSESTIALGAASEEEERSAVARGRQRDEGVADAARRRRALDGGHAPRPAARVEDGRVVAEVEPLPVGGVVPAAIHEHALAVEADCGVAGARPRHLPARGGRGPLHRGEVEQVRLREGALGVVASEEEDAPAGEARRGGVGAAGGRAACCEGAPPRPVVGGDELVQLRLEEAARGVGEAAPDEEARGVVLLVQAGGVAGPGGGPVASVHRLVPDLKLRVVREHRGERLRLASRRGLALGSARRPRRLATEDKEDVRRAVERAAHHGTRVPRAAVRRVLAAPPLAAGGVKRVQVAQLRRAVGARCGEGLAAVHEHLASESSGAVRPAGGRRWADRLHRAPLPPPQRCLGREGEGVQRGRRREHRRRHLGLLRTFVQHRLGRIPQPLAGHRRGVLVVIGGAPVVCLLAASALLVAVAAAAVGVDGRRHRLSTGRTLVHVAAVDARERHATAAQRCGCARALVQGAACRQRTLAGSA